MVLFTHNFPVIETVQAMFDEGSIFKFQELMDSSKNITFALLHKKYLYVIGRL